MKTVTEEEKELIQAGLMPDPNDESKTESTESTENPPEEEVEKKEGVGEGELQARRGDVGGEHKVDGDAENAAGEVVRTPDSGEDQEGSTSTALATTDDVRRMDTHNTWVKTLIPRIPKGVSINEKGSLLITSEATDDSLASMALMFSEADLRSEKMSMQCKWNIGKTVSELSLRNDLCMSQVISDLGLCEGTGRSHDVVYAWCKAARELPEECFNPNLTITHLTNAAFVKKPENLKLAMKFDEKRIELLAEAAANPDGISSRQVSRELKQIAAALEGKEVIPVRNESLGIIRERLLENYRVKEVAEIDPSVLERNGIDMRDLVTQIEADNNQLIDRHLIHEDAAQIVLHWTGASTTDVSAVDITGEKENAETHTEGKSEEQEECEDSESDKEESNQEEE